MRPGEALLLAVVALAAAAPQARADDVQTGRQLNAARRHAEAVVHLEAAMLRAPDDHRIHLEYAIALAGSGDVASAQQLLLQLRDTPELDDATRRQIDALIRRDRLRAYLPERSRGSLGLAIGHDDNLRGAPRPESFAMTLPGGGFVVAPADDAGLRAGGFARADLRLEGTLSADASPPLRYGLFLGIRKTADRIADREHWGLLLEQQHLLFPGSYLQAAHQQLAVQDARVYRQTQLGAGLTIADAAADRDCRSRLGGELQQRRYPQAEHQDGRYAGLQIHVTCLSPALKAVLRYGQDRPARAGRPGGAWQQAAVRLAYRARVFQGALQVEAEWSWQQDDAGYSPWLENNRRRVLRRSIHRIDYLWDTPAGAPTGWQPFLSLEWLQQQANLPLFSLRNRIVSAGAIMTW